MHKAKHGLVRSRSAKPDKSSGSHKAVIILSSGNCQAVNKQYSGILQTVIMHYSTLSSKVSKKDFNSVPIIDCHLPTKKSLKKFLETIIVGFGQTDALGLSPNFVPSDTITYKFRLTPPKYCTKKPMLFLASMGGTGLAHHILF